MKITRNHVLCSTLFIIGVLIFGLFLSCDFPGDEPPPTGANPCADIKFLYHIDPYIVTGKPFRMCMVLDLYDGTLGAYDISIEYNTAKMELNIDENINGVTPGADGFVTSVGIPEPGRINIIGMDETGIDPKKNVQLFIVSWTAVESGDTEFLITINQLTTTDGKTFDAPDSYTRTITIKEPVFFPLTGLVVDSIGGSPVEGAKVRIKGMLYETFTESNGSFSFDEVIIGIYDIVVTKSGRAGSKLEQVCVVNDRTYVEIMQPEYNYLPEEVTPPSIMIKGIRRNKVHSGFYPIEINVLAGSCPVEATESHYSIYLKMGMTGMTYYEVANSSTDTLSYVWNTTFFPPGDVTIKVVAYDTNNNRSELNIRVFVTADPGEKPGVAPLEESYYIVANTYGQSLEITRVYPNFPEMLKQTIYAHRAPPDTTILVNFSVEKYYNGIAVYRSITQQGPYTLAGQTSYSESHTFKFVDYSQDLQPGITVYYKLAYFNQYGIGPKTDSISIRILEKYNLFLVSPDNNLNITDTTPTLTWTCVPSLDAQRTDWIIVTNIIDTTIVAYSFVINQTEYTLPTLLYNNKYEWDVRSFYEYVNSVGMANVLSRSFPKGKGSYDFSMNGAFYFTVIEQE